MWNFEEVKIVPVQWMPWRSIQKHKEQFGADEIGPWNPYNVVEVGTDVYVQFSMLGNKNRRRAEIDHLV